MNSSGVELARNSDINTTSHSTILFSSNKMKTSFVNISTNYTNENTLNLKRNFSQIKHMPNMCSSMISLKKNQTLRHSLNGKANNLKRIKQAIANKLKKFQIRRSLKTSEALPSSDNAKLVKFNYKSYFVLPDTVETSNNKVELLQSSNQCCSCSPAQNKLNSDGEQSFTSSSSSSSSSCSSLHSFSEHEVNSDLFLVNSNNDMVSCMFKTMPFNQNSTSNTLRITSTPNKKSNKSMYLDQSTQIQIDSPVLIESTFNTSSCSDLSDDLIILQTAATTNTNTNTTSTANAASFVGNDLLLNANQVPDWARGPQLSLAVVNQHYFNHEAASEIFF